MKIVITGALGHIGSRFIREIPAAVPDADIYLYDNLATQRHCSLFNLPSSGSYRFIESSILDEALEKTIQGADIVVHLAALVDPTESYEQQEAIETINYQGTARVADVCLRQSVPLLFVSSTSVYEGQSGRVEESLSFESLVPKNPYARSKLRAEKYIEQLRVTNGLRCFIFRFGTICGISPGMRFQTAVNKFCWQAAMGQRVTVWETALHQKRPYLDLSDAVRALLVAIQNKNVPSGIYNIITENRTVDSILQVISPLVAHFHSELVPAKVMSTTSYEAYSEKMEPYGFTPSGSIDQCIADTISLLQQAHTTKHQFHP